MRFHLPLHGIGAAALLIVLLAAIMPSAALAHERRAVGKYSFVVGFNGEPALQGQPNGAQVTITGSVFHDNHATGRAFGPGDIPWSGIAFKTSYYVLADWLARRHPDIAPGPAVVDRY